MDDSRDSLAMQAYGEIKRRILTGELERGTRLSVEALAHQFDVSAAPIKEALKLLEREGLVDIRPRSGTVVRSFSPEDLINVYGARKIVEPAAAAMVAAQRPAPDALIAGLEQSMVTLHGALQTFAPRQVITDTDSLFHRLIVEAAGNPVLTELHAMLIDRARLVRFYGTRPGRSAEAMEEHRRIIEALKTGDAVAARAASTIHLEGAERAILETMQSGDAR
ncbi:MAG: GntR family transcriptional regulator [Devosia sp.]